VDIGCWSRRQAMIAEYVDRLDRVLRLGVYRCQGRSNQRQPLVTVYDGLLTGCRLTLASLSNPNRAKNWAAVCSVTAPVCQGTTCGPSNPARSEVISIDIDIAPAFALSASVINPLSLATASPDSLAHDRSGQ